MVLRLFSVCAPVAVQWRRGEELELPGEAVSGVDYRLRGEGIDDSKDILVRLSVLLNAVGTRPAAARRYHRDRGNGFAEIQIAGRLRVYATKRARCVAAVEGNDA